MGEIICKHIADYEELYNDETFEHYIQRMKRDRPMEEIWNWLQLQDIFKEMFLCTS
jgi:hypothetical protein